MPRFYPYYQHGPHNTKIAPSENKAQKPNEDKKKDSGGQ